MNRQYGSLLVWNEPGVTLTLNAAGAIQSGGEDTGSGAPRSSERSSSVSAPSAAIGTTYANMLSILKNSQLLQRRLHETARTVEVID